MIMTLESAPLAYGQFATLPVHVQEDMLARARVRAILANPKARKEVEAQMREQQRLTDRQKVIDSIEAINQMR